MSIGYICRGCQPRRDSILNKHKGKAQHRCSGNGCGCGSCYPRPPVTQEQYRTWMEKLGGFYVGETKALIAIVKSRKLKPDD